MQGYLFSWNGFLVVPILQNHCRFVRLLLLRTMTSWHRNAIRIWSLWWESTIPFSWQKAGLLLAWTVELPSCDRKVFTSIDRDCNNSSIYASIYVKNFKLCHLYDIYCCCVAMCSQCYNMGWILNVTQLSMLSVHPTKIIKLPHRGLGCSEDIVVQNYQISYKMWLSTDWNSINIFTFMDGSH